MAVPISWAPGILWFFLQETLHAHKTPRFRGGGILGLAGGSANFIFMGAGIFLLNFGCKRLPYTFKNELLTIDRM